MYQGEYKGCRVEIFTKKREEMDVVFYHKWYKNKIKY